MFFNLRHLGLLVMMVVAIVASSRGYADEVDRAVLAKVKAAYILNFIKFTQWPAKTFEDSEEAKSPIIVGVLGNDPDHLAGLLQTLVTDVTVDDRSVVVKHYLLPTRPGSQAEPTRKEEYEQAIKQLHENLKKCHLVYLTALDTTDVDAILKQLQNVDVLTVSDLPQFAQRGGMLGLVLRRNRLIFEANPQAMNSTNIQVSSKLLKLAQIVKTEPL